MLWQPGPVFAVSGLCVYLCEAPERVPGGAADRPVGHCERAEGTVESDALFVPVETAPLQPFASPPDGNRRETREERCSDASPAVLRLYVKILQIDSCASEKRRKVVKLQRESDLLSVLHGENHFRFVPVEDPFLQRRRVRADLVLHFLIGGEFPYKPENQRRVLLSGFPPSGRIIFWSLYGYTLRGKAAKGVCFLITARRKRP